MGADRGVLEAKVAGMDELQSHQSMSFFTGTALDLL
jgi:hypothetical protein